LFLKYFGNWKSLGAAMMQTRVQVYYGSHAISSYENITIAEHQQDMICKTEKLSEKSTGIFNSNTSHPTLELVSRRTFHNELHLSKLETRKIPVTINTRSLYNKYKEKSQTKT
jgi:hypothetical protein